MGDAYERIKVAIRCRPMINLEIEKNQKEIIQTNYHTKEVIIEDLKNNQNK